MSVITSPYETLIRHNSDGSIGAHHQKIKRYFDDETEPPELINERIQPPVQLDVAGGEVAAVVGQAFVQATAQIAAMEVLVAAANAAAAAASGQLEVASATIAQRDVSIADLEAQVAALQAIIDAQNAAKAEAPAEPEAESAPAPAPAE